MGKCKGKKKETSEVYKVLGIQEEQTDDSRASLKRECLFAQDCTPDTSLVVLPQFEIFGRGTTAVISLCTRGQDGNQCLISGLDSRYWAVSQEGIIFDVWECTLPQISFFQQKMTKVMELVINGSIDTILRYIFKIAHSTRNTEKVVFQNPL